MIKGKGKFIVIDGSDGSGKKTQSDLLVEKLKTDGHPVSYYDFPQYDKTFFGAMVGRYLNGEFGDLSEINPYLISLLYAGDRWQASESIKKDLAEGKVVVSNRYIQSNMAFSGARFATVSEREKFLEWLDELEYKVYGIPHPDLVIYLYVPYKIGQELVDKKEKRNYTAKKRDIHEKDAEYLEQVENTYLWLAERCKEWKKIDCIDKRGILPIETIAKKVSSIALSKLQSEEL